MAALNLDVSPDVIQAIGGVAHKLKLTKDELAQKIFALYIEQLEDEADCEECEAAWNEAAANGEKPIPSDEFWRKFGL